MTGGTDSSQCPARRPGETHNWPPHRIDASSPRCAALLIVAPTHLFARLYAAPSAAGISSSSLSTTNCHPLTRTTFFPLTPAALLECGISYFLQNLCHYRNDHNRAVVTRISRVQVTVFKKWVIILFFSGSGCGVDSPLVGSRRRSPTDIQHCHKSWCLTRQQVVSDSLH